MKTKQYMRISELVKRSNLPRSTIHFYLRKGLLHPPLKTGDTMAYYDESHLERLRLIQKMKMDMRMPITFIQKQLDELERLGNTLAGEMAPKGGEESEKPLPPRDRRKMEIIKTAVQVFAEKGYHRAKVADITQALKISTGTFYLYFNNKRDLFMEVINDVFKNIVGEASRAIKNEKDFQKRLQIRGRVFHENYVKYNEILNQLRAEMAGDDDWPQQKIRDIYHSLTKPVIQELDEAVKAGVIRDIDPDLSAYALTGLIEILSFRLTVDTKYSFDDVLNYLTDLLSDLINSQKP